MNRITEKILLDSQKLKVLIMAEREGQGEWVKDVPVTRNGQTFMQGRDKYGFPAKRPQTDESSEILGQTSQEELNTALVQGGEALKETMANPNIKKGIFSQINLDAFSKQVDKTLDKVKSTWVDSGMANVATDLFNQAQGMLENIPIEDLKGFIGSAEFAKSMAVAGVGVLCSLMSPPFIALSIGGFTLVNIAPIVAAVSTAKNRDVIFGEPKEKIIAKLTNQIKAKGIDPNSILGKKILSDGERYLYGMKFGENFAKTTAKGFSLGFNVASKMVPFFALYSTASSLYFGFQTYQKLHGSENKQLVALSDDLQDIGNDYEKALKKIDNTKNTSDKEKLMEELSNQTNTKVQKIISNINTVA